MPKSRFTRLAAMPLAGALAFTTAACDSEPETVNLEADVDESSTGEFVVEPEDPNAVPVDLPETEMTNAPPEEQTDPEDMSTEPTEGMNTAAE